MAATLSSPVFAISASCSSYSSSLKSRNFNFNFNFASSSYSLSHFRHNSRSSRPFLSRDGLSQNSSDDPNSSFDDEDDNSVLSKEESELEKEIKRLILTGNSDRLKPNSGQAVTVGDHHAYVGFHEENGSDNRVWEWHGHSLRFDNENGYRPECTYGSCIERLPSNRSGTGDGEEAVEEKEGEKVVANLGLRHLIDGGKAGRGISRVLHRNIDAGSSSGTARAIRKLYKVHATLLQDNEEQVEVEESFLSSTSLNDQVNGSREGLSESSSSNTLESSSSNTSESSSSNTLEKIVIKFEQLVNILLTDSVIKILDTLYRDRDYARFFVLETIARVPYFAFMSVLHMYESFGWWRRADYLKVHFAESWNEMHHLLIMEELGGNSWWFDRFLAQHIAIFYYILTVFMYSISPRMAYHFSECVESHAFSTYDKFIKARGDELKKLPAPEIAVKYYTGDDLYLFDEFQTSRPPNSRRPKIENLYDVFLNVRDDEAEHCKTMKACQTHGNLRSPHSYLEDELDDKGACAVPQADCEGIVDCLRKSVTTPSPTTQK